MTRMLAGIFHRAVAVTLSISGAFAAQPAVAHDVAQMMQRCRVAAATALNARLPDVDTKYEGQRVDGTHAVNGAATVQGRPRTFQCSFSRAGTRIVRFVVNKDAVIVPASPAAAPAQSAPDAVSAASRRAGAGEFDATGTIPCSLSVGQPTGSCPFGVARAGNGSAAVSIALPDGRRRIVFFVSGRATGADTSQADGDSGFSASREGDLSIIRVGPQRFEIPDAVIYGG